MIDHGDGDEHSPIVQLQYHEIIDQLNQTRDENPWWDFRELVNTRAARYRLYMVIGMSFFGQWSGNNVVSYFMVRPTHANLLYFLFKAQTDTLQARNDCKCRHQEQEQPTPHQRHQPNLLNDGRDIRRHTPRQTRPPLHDARRALRCSDLLHPPDSLHGLLRRTPQPLLRDHRLHHPLRHRLRLGFHSSPNPLRRRVFGEPHSCQGFRTQLPVPQRRHGGQYLWYQCRYREDWVEVVCGLYRVDLCRVDHDLLFLRGDCWEDVGGDE